MATPPIVSIVSNVVHCFLFNVVAILMSLMRSRSEADTNNGMVVDYYREGYYSSVTWLSCNKGSTYFEQQLNTFFSDYVQRVYKLEFAVSNDPSSMVSEKFKSLFISRTKRRINWKR